MKAWKLWGRDPITGKPFVKHEFMLGQVAGIGIEDDGLYYVKLRSGQLIRLSYKEALNLSGAKKWPMPTLSDEENERRIRSIEASRHLYD